MDEYEVKALDRTILAQENIPLSSNRDLIALE